MSISTVKNNIAESILSMKQDWDGDILELDCDWKDHFCYIFLAVIQQLKKASTVNNRVR